jgi:thiosulfate/3-mercaptopyruvate sulfurtransferase
LIEPSALASELGGVTVLDVRWELGDGPALDAYRAGHIPGAVFVDLETELAGPPGAGGRHPLPPPDAFEAAMRRAGVSLERPVAVYDGAAAARAWWLLRYYGHPRVAVLNGGWRAWMDAGYEVEAGDVVVEGGDFVARVGGMPMLDAAGAAKMAVHGVLVDARAPERYRGEHEPIDPVAGHIPGAVNLPSTELVDAAGRYLEAPAIEAPEIGVYCGSGVTAAQAVLALELAGRRAALYVGSWSDWITDPARPVAAATVSPAAKRVEAPTGRE